MKHTTKKGLSDQNRTATTRDIKKILTYLAENGSSYRNEIRKATGLASYKINDALNLLKRLRIVSEDKTPQGTKYYTLTYDTN